MLAGLLSNDGANNVSKVPFLGDIPVLGALFKSRQFTRNETELVIVVTPYLVRPVNASAISLPTDGFRTATELQGLVEHKAADGVSDSAPPRPVYVPPADAAPPPTPAEGINSGRRRDGSKPAPGFSF
jgi:pilus assembly protein CpaC